MKKLLVTFFAVLAIGFVGYCLITVLQAGWHQTVFGDTTAGLRPIPSLTPGRANTLSLADLRSSDWCNDHMIGDGPACQQTYSQSHREVSVAIKKRVYAEYGVEYPQAAGAYEVDHFYPLCAGGSNDIENLWLEPAHVYIDGEDYGFHTKDALEAYICRGIKNGSISPQEAYKRVTKDWISYYRELFSSPQFGSFAADDMEGDTE